MADFTDRPGGTETKGAPACRKDYLFSFGGHVVLLVFGLIAFNRGAVRPVGGDGAVSVRMVTVDPAASVQLQEVSEQEEIPEEVPDEQVEEISEEVPDEQVEELPEEIPDEQAAVIPDQVPDEQVEELPEEVPNEQVEELPEETSPQPDPPAGNYATLSGSGTAGSGMPGPGTYESRVFNAIRRNFRTSVEPERSYRIVYTVHPDGSVEVEVIRDSRTSAFDRAVENALSMAQIPPMPPGRSAPVVLSIEFLASE